MIKNRRRIKYLGTPIQKKLLILIFASATIPTVIAVVSFYYLIFELLARQIGIPEAIAYNLLPVVQKINLILLICIPVVFFLIWRVALEFSHRIAGPLYRIERELDDRISGKSTGEIRLRPKDEFRNLADKINKLLNK